MSVANALWVEVLEVQMGKLQEHLESFENKSQFQNVRIVRLKEGEENKTLVEFFEKWIPEILAMQRTES